MTENGHNGELSPRELAALAAAWLAIDAARLYGLVTGAPDVDREQCAAVLERLEREGIVPSEDEVDATVVELVAELGAARG